MVVTLVILEEEKVVMVVKVMVTEAVLLQLSGVTLFTIIVSALLIAVEKLLE